jgi:threonine dehydrogenase-like Zn-dependent dehydrogenase
VDFVSKKVSAMKAVRWHGKRDVRVEEVPEPRIEEPTDAIVRITTTNICGSDLHLYEVLSPFLEDGDILGHEPIGVVEEVGSDAAQHIQPGDRVVIPFNISCGRCWMCHEQLYAQCETTQNREYGKGASLFGYTKLYGHVPGGQAEYLRVPQAQFGPIKVPDGPVDDRFVYLSDVLPTGWQAAAYANIPKGGSVAVYGLGPVGQFSARSALVQGAEHVFGVDIVPERLAMAARHGIEVIDANEVDDVPGYLADGTDGRGPDSVIDAVGMEAHGNSLIDVAQEVVARLPSAVGRPVAERFGIDQLTGLQAFLHDDGHLVVQAEGWIDALVEFLDDLALAKKQGGRMARIDPAVLAGGDVQLGHDRRDERLGPELSRQPLVHGPDGVHEIQAGSTGVAQGTHRHRGQQGGT